MPPNQESFYLGRPAKNLVSHIHYMLPISRKQEQLNTMNEDYLRQKRNLQLF